MDFRKRAQHYDITILTDIAHRVRPTIEKLVVGLVENGNDIVRQVFHKIVNLGLIDKCSGGIIRVGDKNQPSPRCDSVEHGGEMMPEIRAWDLDRLNIEQGRDNFIRDKAILRGHNAIATIKERVPNQFNDLVRPITQNDVLGAKVESFSDGSG